MQAGVRTAVREFTAFGWITLTAALAGLIGVSGLSSLSHDPVVRNWMSHGLWLLFGATVAAIWFLSPPMQGENFGTWFTDWMQSRHKAALTWLVFLGTAAVAGSWALREQASSIAWRRVSIGAIFAGTALSLIAIAVLIFFGGFSPLPTWVYCAVAVGQSSLAWAILMTNAGAQPYTHPERRLVGA
jgi:hypothetical protein